MSSKIQNEGRLYYIDPNNIYNDIQNGIPHPYEDYCISVDLTIQFGDRDSCGIWGNLSQPSIRPEYTFQSDRGTINFIGGTNGYLTTNYTDVQSVNPQENTNECLGIESINIAYTSWYVPEVKIRFVDVRGASLMGPQEQGYVETIRMDEYTGHKGDTSIIGGSFFKALFSFPYPMFKLKVKGFYGREVTYNLSVEDFQGNFNADNGNYEIDVKFIGYMYGIYTDIPMNYLMVAPFFDDGSGRGYWEAQKLNGRFLYYGGLPFKNYVELRKAIADVPKNSIPPTTDGDKRLYDKKIQLDNRLGALRKIQDDIHTFLKNIFDVGYCYGKMSKVDGVQYVICGISTKYKEINFTEEQSRRKNKGIYYANNDYQMLVRSVLDYNEKYQDSTIGDLNYFGLRNSGNTNGVLTEVTAKDSSGLSFYNGYIESTKSDQNETLKKWCLNTIKDEIDGGKIVNSSTLYVYVPSFIDIQYKNTVPESVVQIDKKIDITRKNLEAVESEIQGKAHENVSRSLGFGTSIGNAFNMAFAHMETFINIFNEYLHKIHLMKGNGKRSLKTLGSTLADTDLSANFSIDRNVPPFTMFYKEVENDNSGNSGVNTKSGKKRVAMWPGNLPGNTSALVEIDFVNRLIDAAKFFGNEMGEIDKAMNEARDMADRRELIESQIYVPTTLFDLAHTKTENPYSYLSGVSGGNKQWELLLMTFVLRYVYWYSASNNESAKKGDVGRKSFGEIEAYNVFRAFPNIQPAIKEWLKSGWAENLDNVLHYLTDYKNENEPRKAYDVGREYSNDFAFALDKSKIMRYCWLFLKENGANRYVYPIGKINPANANPYNARTSNEDYIYLLEDGEQPNTVFVSQYAAEMDGRGPYIDFQVDSVRYVDNIETLNGTAKKAYKEQILPSLNVNRYTVGRYAIKTTSGFLSGTGPVSQTLPNPNNENGNHYYVDSPSFIVDGEHVCPTYGHPLFYAQNELSDYKDRMLAKAYLFLTGIPMSYTPNTTLKQGQNMVMPYLMALAYGARLYRNDKNTGTTETFLNIPEGILSSPDIDYCSKHSNYTFYGQYDTTFKIVRGSTDTSVFEPSNTIDNLKDFSEATKSALKKMFESWALSDFANDINNIFELKGTYTGSYAEFVSCVDKVSEYNKGKRNPKEPLMSVMFSDSGSFNREFYDQNGVVTEVFGKAIKLPVIHVCNEQQKVIDLFNRQVVVIDTANLNKRDMSITVSEFADGLNGFINKLNDIYESQIENETKPVDTENGPIYDPARDEDLKLSTYMTLKNIYDRWLCMNREPNRWKLDGGEASEFSQFKYIDGFYRDLKTRIAVNFEHINELASQMLASSNITNDATSTKYMGRSFYDFLSAICQKNQMVMLALPMENEFDRPEGIVELFDVKSYSNMETRDTSCYVCLYSNQPSQHLDIQYDTDEYMYATDGFNLANAKGLIVSDLIPQIKDVDVDGYKIPAFGVTYAKQNQSIFNRISVNMQNPQVTEASIAATQLIASKNNEGGHQTALYGQDLYRIYANYSYTCTVEMLGNAQIMPLMYFQLNNIPLFRGAYMIINIEHSISAGRMTTKFTGVRMSRFDTPLVSDMGLFTDPFIPSTVYSRGEGSNVEILASGYDNIDFTKETYSLFLNDNMPNRYSVTMQDLVYSDTATARNIDNSPAPNSKELSNLEGLMTLLNELENAWTWYCSQHRDEKWAQYDGIYITSGYRCEELNKAVGSKPGGPHTHGNAADMHVCKYDTTRRNTTTKKANYHNGLPVISHDYSCPVFFEFVIKFMAASGRGWGQIIDERKGNSKWVHLGYQTADGGTAKKEILQYRNGDYFKLKME